MRKPAPRLNAPRLLPQVRFLQGKQHTWYCGSYTLINTHEIAVMSGEPRGAGRRAAGPPREKALTKCRSRL